MFFASFISLSRGGIISFFAGITVFALLFSWDRFRAKKRLALAFFIFAVFLYLLYLGIDPVIERFYKTDIIREDRLDAALKIAKEAFKKTKLNMRDIENSMQSIRRKIYGEKK